MGLAMCRQVVARHGGTITAEGNGDDPGVTVVVTLPVPDPTASSSLQDHDALRELGVLVRPTA